MGQAQDYNSITSKLHDEVAKLLKLEDIKYIIGWKPGSYGLRISPAFIEDEKDISKLIWSPFCINNLSVYPTLEEKLPLPRGVAEDIRRIGVLVKGCDSRGLVQLFIENGMPRERLVIIGCPCTGQIDPEKFMPILLEKDVDKNIQLNDLDVTDLDDKFRINIKIINLEFEIPKIDVIYNKCLTCKYPNPIISDILLSSPVEVRGKAGEGYEKVQELEALSPDEKWKYWAEKFDRCIRCNSCREICPVCYCRECLIDKWEPDWVQKSVNLTENTMYHIIRAYHMAG
ncbi:MAG: Coenzyme F420 hydrogenase/dehydrogenase, beta subunit C-terminal domain, partial [Thermoplasmata archaeon]|nr:Coenzyme F420 hydrogenase/dehydrogenase, beta subunit C-terminal domain [Thermoplasmata archaeon]